MFWVVRLYPITVQWIYRIKEICVEYVTSVVPEAGVKGKDK